MESSLNQRLKHFINHCGHWLIDEDLLNYQVVQWSVLRKIIYCITKKKGITIVFIYFSCFLIFAVKYIQMFITATLVPWVTAHHSTKFKKNPCAV